MASMCLPRSNLVRMSVAVAALHLCFVVVTTEAHAQDRGRQRGGAPITFAHAATQPLTGQGAPQAAIRQETSNPQGMLSWRYPDQPELVYGGGQTTPASASTVRSSTVASPTSAPTSTLDLRRTSPQPISNTSVARAPATPARERPDWLQPERVGAPYQEAGQWYVPTPEPGFSEQGRAGVYQAERHNQATASGEVFDIEGLTAAHPTLPLPSLIQVTNLATGRDVIVRLNDRGPFVNGRLIDLSRGAARALGIDPGGEANVHVRYLGPAPRRVGETPASPPLSARAPRVEAAPPPVAPRRPLATPSPIAYTPPVAGPPQGGFVVQLGAFSNLENAHRVRAMARTAGVVVIEPVQTSQGELFRVRLGPYASYAEATSAQAQASRLGVGSGVIAELR